MSELKACPFCGETPEIRDWETNASLGNDQYMISCCNIEMQDSERDSLVDNWNTRPAVGTITPERVREVAEMVSSEITGDSGRAAMYRLGVRDLQRALLEEVGAAGCGQA